MEWMVVIAVVAIAMMIAIEAVSFQRCGYVCTTRMHCQSNLRNVTLGLLGYVNAHGAFPPSGVFAEDEITLQNLRRGNTDPRVSVVPTYFPGAPDAPRGVPMYSWVVPILPYLDNMELHDEWTMEVDGYAVPYFDRSVHMLGRAGNHKIASTGIGVLRCPDDATVRISGGNQSYVVNGGFALWHAYPVGWVGGQTDGKGTTTSGPLTWAPSRLGWSGTIDVTQKLGVMFIETRFPKGMAADVTIPWNVRSTPAGILDGASNTLLVSENSLTGVGAGPSSYSRGLPTNWAIPLPNFTSFFGPSNVCGSGNFPQSLDCTSGGLAPKGSIDGPDWALANTVGTHADINFGQKLTIEGSFPFSNSPHPLGCNMGFCDGSVRFISKTIDGTVYSKLITRAGGTLPNECRQGPLAKDSFYD